VLLSAIPATGMTATLVPSQPSPVPVGTMITWNASVSDASDGTIWYRFRARELGGSYQLIRDYGPLTSLDWTAADHEGLYEIELSARNRDTGESDTTSIVYQMLSQVTVRDAVVTPTAHPLVFLYSAVCPGGARMKVQFYANDGLVQETPSKTCQAGRSMNVYLAGLRANTAYSARHLIDAGRGFVTGPDILFGMGQAAGDLFTQTVAQAPTVTVSNQILLGSSLNGAVATDLQGNTVWYTTNGIYVVTRPEEGGYFWGTIGNPRFDVSEQVIRKFDLVGMTVLETNAARVNEQLTALGRRQISGFHHEVRTLPDGKIVALADVEQILTDVQGPGPVDVIGDMIVVFDSDLNVIWAWDTFDHLDVTRAAVLGETCGAISACAPFYLAKTANDWTHGNAIQQTPDGELLYSTRHQDWLVKISYNRGLGDGHVIWRLGKDGDFQINSSDPWPWFSHQHDANFEFSDPSTLLVFDNGNTRITNQGGNSRGQVLRLDEQSRTASFILNADLGILSIAVGSAQQLRDQNYHFDAGFVTDSSGRSAYSIEVNGSGDVVYTAKANTILYRTFRMTSMYAPN
jgi:arylsulfate sulfotransferase